MRRRPGMYIGGTDERALHHLAAEVLDNAMDEAVAGHATRIEVKLEPGNRLTIVDNGRGIPVDPHPNSPTSRHWKSSCRRSTRAASSPARPMRPRAVCTASASPWSTRYRRTRWSRWPASVSSIANALPKVRRWARWRRWVPPQPARHQRRLHAGHRDLRPRTALQARAAAQAGPLQGLSVCGCRNPLALRARTHHRRHACRGGLPVPRRPGRSSEGADRRPRMRHRRFLLR